MKKMTVWMYINGVLGVVFTFLCLSFHADISLVAFPLSLVFTGAIVFFCIMKLLRQNEPKFINTARKLLQYQPFVYLTSFVFQRAGAKETPYVLDLIMVFVWIAVTVSSFVVLHYLNEKRVYTLNKNWEKYHKDNPVVKVHGIKRVGIEALEWIDALVQAVYTILIINIFFFQLYEIPSESMVPEFLIKDRVAVFKTLAGPKFPLSDVGLPYIKKYDRGDIVVLRNPHYTNDRKSQVKTFVSNFVYMATLTLVNTNKDEYGNVKYDPLVKRLTGLPGEQLMMMDGSLYSRTKESSQFKKVVEDEKWAAWDLNSLPSRTKAKIELIPMNTDDTKETLDIEEKRRSLDMVSASLECNALVKEFNSYANGGDASADEVKSLYADDDLTMYSLFSKINNDTVNLLSVKGGKQWFTEFMTDWQNEAGDLSKLKELDADGNVILEGDSLVGGDLYTDSNFRLDVMAKLLYGRLVVRNAQLIASKTPVKEWSDDEKRNEILYQAQILYKYIERLDQRNMPVFPANDASGGAQYIPQNCYFMMGDNRYNSLDLRHSYTQTLVSLSTHDDLSVKYNTNMAPQYVNRTMVLGKASFRFWPLSRMGVPGKGGRN